MSDKSNLPAKAVFSLRDFNRQPAIVLEAVRKFGSAEIQTRSGEVFTMSAQPKQVDRRTDKRFPDFSARWQKLGEPGHVLPTAAGIERIDRIIVGHE